MRPSPSRAGHAAEDERRPVDARAVRRVHALHQLAAARASEITSAGTGVGNDQVRAMWRVECGEWRALCYQAKEVHDGVDQEHEDEGAEVVAAEEDGDRADHHLVGDNI